MYHDLFILSVFLGFHFAIFNFIQSQVMKRNDLLEKTQRDYDLTQTQRDNLAEEVRIRVNHFYSAK